LSSPVARIATVCQNGAFFPSVEKNRDHVLSLLEHAVSIRPDLVVLPETFTTVSLDRDLPRNAEPVPGPTTEACARVARRAGTYVVCPIQTVRDGSYWNSAVIIDRKGEIVGVYDKAHPVTSTQDYTEAEYGMRPGRFPPPVFDLDFGRIGIQICFDAGFPESWAELARQGARMILWPSAYNGGFPLQAYAYLHHVYVVTSVRTDGSRIIDPLGAVRAKTDQRLTMIWEDIHLDFEVFHWDFNYAIPESIVAKYGDRVVVRSDRDSAHFLVEPRDPSIELESLKAEFGFESTAEYHDRHRVAYRALRDGLAAAPQQAAHASRSQYGK
jgi:beta-ureidopropionase